MTEGILFEDGQYDYGKPYFDEYMVRGNSIPGIVLNTLRVNLAKKYAKELMLDVGCGAGSFIKYMWSDNSIKVYGYDVNEYSVKWLNSKNIYYDINILPGTQFDCVTFFDSFEHIREHNPMLNKFRKGCYAILSMPIFATTDSAKRSKHYKPGEHLWYFTDYGIIEHMERMKWHFVERTDIEVRAGREGVQSYVFVNVT